MVPYVPVTRLVEDDALATKNLERLEALRRQIGEASWQARIARAREREAIVQEVRRRMVEGCSQAEAIRGLNAKFTEQTISRWLAQYATSGLSGLIDSTGRLTTVGQKDPIAKPRSVAPRKTRSALSFIKWVGSKQSILPQLMPRMPRNFGRYFEPMVGSGVLFLSLRPKQAILADENPELVLCYQIVRDHVESLIRALGQHRNTSDHFHRLRAQVPSTLDPVERAARFIFLNKTCYNGLYRVNRDGHFNVPYGRDARANFLDFDTLRRVSAQLQGVQLRCGDFAEACQDAASGDLLYFDPPYLGTSPSSIRYSQQGFPELAHRRLATLVRELDRRGCLVMVSNSNQPLVRKLYLGYRIDVIQLRRTVNANAAGRAGWDELLIRNFDVPADHRKRHKDRPPHDRQLFLPLCSEQLPEVSGGAVYGDGSTPLQGAQSLADRRQGQIP